MSFSSSSSKNIKIFFAYSQHHQDQGLRQYLEDHLHELKSLGVDSKWRKYQIQTEREWEDEIYKYINTADLIVILVSASFLNESCWDTPINWAKERYQEEEVPLIPVLLRQVNGWQRTLGDLVPLPSNGIAVANSPNRDAAFVEVAQGIVEKVEELKEYQEKLQEYEQYFSEALQREKPLSEDDRALLNQKKHTCNLKDIDLIRIEALVTQEKQELYNKNLQEYKQRWYAVTKREYPISDSTREELKSFQKSFKLKDEDIARIEEQIPQSKEYKNYTETPDISGLGLAAIALILFAACGAFINSQSQNPSDLPSSAFNQIENLTASKKSDGWMFIGSVNNRTTPISSGTPLIRDSEFTDSPIVPAIDSVVTVVRNSVSLRKNKPQPPKFAPQDQQELSKLKYGDQIIIHKVGYFVEPTTIPPVTKVWAEVSRCGQTCNKEKR